MTAPLDLIARWDLVTDIDDVGQPVDGQWIKTNDGIRSIEPGFDRIFALGNINLADYEVTVPITVHHWDETAGTFPAVGMIANWTGHYADGNQPNLLWYPLGAINWTQLGGGVGIVGNAVNDLTGQGSLGKIIETGETYFHKIQVESNGNSPSTFRYKVWHESDPEPSTWDREGTGLNDQHPDGPSRTSGSVALLAHFADATFGDVIIVEGGSSDVSQIADADPAADEVAENGALGATVGITASAIDPDPQDGVTYSLDNDADGRFVIDPITGVITAATVLDFETSPSHTVTVRATSTDSSFSTANFTIDVINRGDTEPEKFFTVDISADKIFEYDTDFNLLRSHDLDSSNGSPVGITTDPTFLRYWVLNSDGRVFVYDYDLLNESFSAAGSVQLTGLTNPQGLATNGTDLWVTDDAGQNDFVQFFDDAALLTTGTAALTSSFTTETGNNFPEDITTDGTFLWVLNNGGGKNIFKYQTDGTFVGRFNLVDENLEVKGIAVDPGSPDSIWVTSLIGDKVLRYNDAVNQIDGFRTADVIYNLPAANTNAQGIAAFRTTTGPLQPLQDVDADPNEVLENQVLGTPVGIKAFANDPDSNEAATYSLDDDANGQFVIDPSNGTVTTAAVLDSQVATSHTIVVRATSPDTSTVTETFTIEVISAAEAEAFFLADQASGLFEYDSSFTYESDHGLVTSQARGVATTATGGTQWTVHTDGTVDVYSRSGQHNGSWTGLDLQSPEGIATDGRHIWVLDSGGSGQDRVFFYEDGALITEGNVSATSNFRLAQGNSEAWGITTDGESLWTVDTTSSIDGEVFKYDLAGNLIGRWTFSTSEGANVVPSFGTARGITIDPGNVNDIWIALRGNDTVLRYDGGALFTDGIHLPDAVIPLNIAAGNTSSQGIAKSGIGLGAPPTVAIDPLVTNDRTPELTGTVSDPTATIEVQVGGNTYSATNNQDGTWTLVDGAISTPLNELVYDVIVTATNTVGNSATDDTVDELTIDITAPNVTINQLTTSDQTPSLTGTVNDATALVEVTVAGNTYVAVNNGDSTWTLPNNAINPPLADGDYNVLVTATDPAGNQGSDSGTGVLTIDLTPPIITVFPVSTPDRTPELTGNVNDLDAVIQVTIDGNTFTAVNNGDFTWTLPDDTIDPPLAEGIYNVIATATDPVGNVGTDATTNELDLDPPPAVTVNQLFTNQERPQLTGDVDDPEAAVSITITGHSGGPYIATNNQDGTWTLPSGQISPVLADGTYDVVVTATDVGLNQGSDSTTNELTVDATAPVVTINPLTTFDRRPPLTGTVDDDDVVITLTVGGKTHSTEDANLPIVISGDGSDLHVDAAGSGNFAAAAGRRHLRRGRERHGCVGQRGNGLHGRRIDDRSASADHGRSAGHDGSVAGPVRDHFGRGRQPGHDCGERERSKLRRHQQPGRHVVAAERRDRGFGGRHLRRGGAGHGHSRVHRQ